MRPTYWTNPPRPFLPGSRRAPVPGWGVNPAVAGPARVGVGQIDPSMMSRYFTKQGGDVVGDEPPPPPPVEGAGIPWWYFAVGAVVLTAGAAVAYNMGVFD